MKATARADYALRATAFLAGIEVGNLAKADTISRTERIPREFLETILRDLRLAGILRARRGSEGGYALARPAAEITVSEVLHAVGDALVDMPDANPDAEADGMVVELWSALTASIQELLSRITVADVAAGLLPDRILDLANRPSR